MAATSFSLTAGLQDVFPALDAGRQAPANATPVNANQAQGEPAPADTVTLTNQAAEGQQTGQDGNGSHFDRAAALGVAGAGAYMSANGSRANRHASEPTLPVLLPQIQTQDAPPAAASNAGNTADNAAANAANNSTNAANTTAADPATNGNATTPQQELQQLDQSLQQLGINPQSIPLFNRMAMLLYANDPPALQLLVQTLQTAATQQGAAQPANSANAAASVNQDAAQAALLPTGATSANNQAQEVVQPAAVAPATAQPSANEQLEPQPETQTGEGIQQIDVITAQIDFTDVQATLQPTQIGPQTSANAATNTQPSPLTVQIGQLQVAFQSVEIQQGPLQLDGSSGPIPSGAALNVTA